MASDRNPLWDDLLRAMEARPGLSPVQLERITGCSRSSLDAALHRLAKSGRIEDRGQGRHHAYFLAGSPAGIVNTLRGHALFVFNAIIATDGASFGDVRTRLGVSASELTRIADELERIGLASRVRSAGELYLVPSAI